MKQTRQESELEVYRDEIKRLEKEVKSLNECLTIAYMSRSADRNDEVRRFKTALNKIVELRLSDYDFKESSDRFAQGYVDAKNIAIKALKQ